MNEYESEDDIENTEMGESNDTEGPSTSKANTGDIRNKGIDEEDEDLDEMIEDGEDGQIDEMEIDTWGLNDWRWRRWTDRWNGNRYMRFKWLKMEKMDR